jgi:hypothetical protein
VSGKRLFVWPACPNRKCSTAPRLSLRHAPLGGFASFPGVNSGTRFRFTFSGAGIDKATALKAATVAVSSPPTNHSRREDAHMPKPSRDTMVAIGIGFAVAIAAIIWHF